jgi:hypothetical protein
MSIGIGIDKLMNLMGTEYAKYKGTQTGLQELSEPELITFDTAIPMMLNRHYTPRVSGVLYSTYAGAYLVGLMRSKKLLGGGMYMGNDGDSGILSKEICFNMLKDEGANQKLKWELTALCAAGWKPLIGTSTAAPSTITDDDFGAMVISHVTSLNQSPNLLEIQYHVNGNPRTPQYIEPAMSLNENQTYQLDIPIMLVKNSKLFVEGNVATANMPVTLMQGGICFANANWLNGHTPTL